MSTRSKWMALVVWVLTAFLLACQSGNQQTETEATTKDAAKETAPPPPPPRQEKITVPVGTSLEVRLVDEIDTGKTAQGAAFEATLAAPLVVHGVDVAPVGSSLTGKVTSVISSGRLNKPAELSLVLTSLTPKGGGRVAISSKTLSMQGKSHKKRDIEMIGGGTGAGALIGALTGGKKGAAIGAAVGAGGGTGVAAATGKKEITLPPETKLAFTLSASVRLPARR